MCVRLFLVTLHITYLTELQKEESRGIIIWGGVCSDLGFWAALSLRFLEMCVEALKFGDHRVSL
jgi:hypothetical protein